MNTNGLIVVGWTAAGREDAILVTPEFKAPSNYGPDKAAEYVAKAKQEWMAGGCAVQPYSGTIKQATIVAFPSATNLRQQAEPKDLGVLKNESDIVVISNFLRQYYSDDLNVHEESVEGPIRFCGFEMRAFAKILGLQAAELNAPLPQSLWYGAEYRDIENAICPEGLKCTRSQAYIRLLSDCPEYQGHVPLGSSLIDAKITLLLLKKLNLFPRWKSEITLATSMLMGEAEAPRVKLTTSPLAKTGPGFALKPKKPKGTAP